MLFGLSDEPPFLAGMAFLTHQKRHSDRKYASHVSIVGGVPLTVWDFQQPLEHCLWNWLCHLLATTTFPQNMYKATVLVTRPPSSLAYMVAMLDLIRLWVSERLSLTSSAYFRAAEQSNLYPSTTSNTRFHVTGIVRRTAILVLQHFGRAKNIFLE